MRYQFKRTSVFFIAAIILYLLSGILWIVGHDMIIFTVLTAILALLCLLFAQGKTQFLLLIPFGLFAAMFMGFYLIQGSEVLWQSDWSEPLYRISMIVYALGFITFFAALFVPKARVLSAGGFFLAFALFFLVIVVEDTFQEDMEEIAVMLSICFFMIPQGLHALTPRLEAPKKPSEPEVHQERASITNVQSDALADGKPKTTRELKQIGKERLASNHLQAVLVLLVPMLIVMAVFAAIMGVIFATETMFLIVFLLLLMFLVVPVSLVGILRFFLTMLHTSDVQWTKVVTAFDAKEYPRNLGRIMQMQIMIQLWSMLLFVPGIVKAFSYAMAPFILADKDATYNTSPITQSRYMMDGRKSKLFVLILSFIGWFLLGALTAGILTIVYVGPYFYQTLAAFYEYEAKPNAKEIRPATGP